MPSGETTNPKEQPAAPTLPSRGDPATLLPGTRFGAYEILSPLGAVGMVTLRWWDR